jgi:transcriptional regulator with XRE-family HTH domain
MADVDLRARLGIRIFKHRERARLTGLQLATLASVSMGTVYNVEKGQCCSIDTLWRICQVLHISLDSLFSEESYGPQRMPSNSERGSDDVRSMSSNVGLQRPGPTKMQPRRESLFQLRNGTLNS